MNKISDPESAHSRIQHFGFVPHRNALVEFRMLYGHIRNELKKCCNDFRIELGPATILYDCNHFFQRHAGPVRSVRADGIEDIGNGNNPGTGINVVARQTLGISLPVKAFMVLAHQWNHLTELLQRF